MATASGQNRKDSRVLGQRGGPLWFGLPFLGFLVALLAFHCAGAAFYGGFALDLGSLFNPGPRYASFLLYWAVLGTLAVAALAVGLSRATSSTNVGAWLERCWSAGSDRAWIAVGCFLALILAVIVRRFLLQDAALTDDECAYRFQAQLLASGRLWIPSPADKIFFDNMFLINDGRLYSQYFLGWPALQAPGVLLGIPGYINGLYSALTVPPLFLALRRLSNSGWARLGVVLYLGSPMILVGAATEMSHAACTMALMWTLWLVLCSRDEGARPRVFAALAVAFSVAFFIRPTSAVAVGLPLLVWALLGLRRRDAHRGRAILAFVFPAAAMALLFLLVNKLQNGGWTTTGYVRYLQYVVENQHRFTGLTPELTERLFTRGNVALALANAGNALLRFNFALFGWPVSLVFIFFAPWRKAGVLWGSFACYFLIHCWHNSAGVDSFGPVHYYELSVGAIALTVVGLQRLRSCLPTSWAGAEPRATPTNPKLIPGVLVAALVTAALAGYFPVRMKALQRMAENINHPQVALSQQGIQNAVVFAPHPFAERRCIAPTMHHRRWRANNHPDLDAEVLWLNQLDPQRERALMRHFPGRTGYRMTWREDCRVEFRPIDRSGKP